MLLDFQRVRLIRRCIWIVLCSLNTGGQRLGGFGERLALGCLGRRLSRNSDVKGT